MRFEKSERGRNRAILTASAKAHTSRINKACFCMYMPGQNVSDCAQGSTRKSTKGIRCAFQQLWRQKKKQSVISLFFFYSATNNSHYTHLAALALVCKRLFVSSFRFVLHLNRVVEQMNRQSIQILKTTNKETNKVNNTTHAKTKKAKASAHHFSHSKLLLLLLLIVIIIIADEGYLFFFVCIRLGECQYLAYFLVDAPKGIRGNACYVRQFIHFVL